MQLSEIENDIIYQSILNRIHNCINKDEMIQKHARRLMELLNTIESKVSFTQLEKREVYDIYTSICIEQLHSDGEELILLEQLDSKFVTYIQDKFNPEFIPLSKRGE